MPEAPAHPASAAAPTPAVAGVATAQPRDAPSVPQASTRPLLLLVLLAAWLLCTLGLRPLLLPDEGRYAGVAREMLTGDWWVPTLDGLPFFHKPPLLYWLDMAAMSMFGSNAFAARIGPALGALLMGAAVLLALRRWHGARMATSGLLVLASCPLYFLSAQYVNHDMLVAGLITVAVFSFVRALEEPPRALPGWLLLAWVACALAMLAKGLIGFVLPAWVIGPWLLWQGRWRQLLRLLHPLGLLAAALVAAPWFIAVQSRYPGFFDYFFMEQHFRRFAQSDFNNVQPFWFFLVVLPVLTLPWSARLPQLLRRAWSRADPQTGLYVWWVAAVLVFFSLPSSKIVGYVLPALAPWCMLLALAFGDAAVRTRRWFAGVAFGICLLLVAGFAWQQPDADRRVARALATRIAAGDRVVMLDEYLYDIGFYARLADPVIVLSDWADPALPHRDNWRKELFDAARFDPARGKALLRPLSDLPRMACGTGVTWFVLRHRQAPRLAALPGAQPVMSSGNTELWKAPGRLCP